MNKGTKKFDRKVEGAESTTIVSLPEVTAETVFRREFSNLKKGLEEQQKLSWQIVIGVAAAFIFTIGLVAVEIMFFHTRADKDTLDLQNQYFQEIKNLQEKNFEMELRLQKEIDSIKTPATQKPQIKTE